MGVTNSLPLKQIVTFAQFPRILIVTFSNSGGHASLVSALQSYLQHDCNIDVLNTEDLERINIGYIYYRAVQNSNFLTKFIYTTHHFLHNYIKTLPNTLLNILYKLTEFEDLLKKNQYDLVIFVSPVHLNAINRMCLNQKIPCINILADYGEPEYANEFWIREKNMIYFIPKGSYVRNLEGYQSLGYLPGIPIRTEVSNMRSFAKDELKKKLNLRKPCVLVFFGSAGSDQMLKLANLFKEDTNKQFVFICGNNQLVRQRLADMKLHHFEVCGYVNNPAEYLRAADVIIGKPGGVTSSEAIHLETPYLFENDPFTILPVEQLNARHIIENKYGENFTTKEELIDTLNLMLTKTYHFPENNSLDTVVTMIRRVLSEKEQWKKRLF